MQKNILHPFTLLVIIVFSAINFSCRKIYNLTDLPVEPKIVVNSLLNPDSIIKIDLWWSQKQDPNIDKYDITFQRVEGARISLYHDNTAIATDIISSANRPITIDHKPQIGSTYKITVDLDGYKYGQIWAETSIPQKPRIDIKHKVKDRSMHYNMDNVTWHSDAYSMMIAFVNYYDPKMIDSLVVGDKHQDVWIKGRWPLQISSTSHLADKFNCYQSETVTNDSPDIYTDFMRIDSRHVPNAFPLNFSVQKPMSTSVYPEGYWDLPYDKRPTNLKNEYELQLITVRATTYEYDRYYKVSLMNTLNSVQSLVSTIQKVPSNVRNGIGIFAGYSDCAKIYNHNKKQLE